jgi:hypothetical protein
MDRCRADALSLRHFRDGDAVSRGRGALSGFVCLGGLGDGYSDGGGQGCSAVVYLKKGSSSASTVAVHSVYA